MKHITQNHDHAWDILIQELTAGRVTHAYGILRLLASTIQDQGLVHVLAGDLYNAAGDLATALNYYGKAYEFYIVEKREKEAAALAEQIKIIGQ